ncbi:ArsR/SmtB family transcription factor [Micromonospora globbae]|jgi:DNA-binding transcriptional ArsR family regulator|uniref:Metalloregulator ArsR/SmtB family transcription factor n=1 Tax=Micromonospora globbae TaxID=1894969 RepID=A0A420EZ25_9ACTN|nr:metalloregulator ArsR/SmtB family transcription factor [Micromonospora globbae]RKF25982.1 transcriptional regulator [Micromonospora globbae]WTF85836.1 metalloregulator ArsR/SmtB family transcription factor [Micromonospora globbae]
MEIHEPELREVPVTVVLAALADDVRLQIVRTLAEGGEYACGTFEFGVSKATRSHHLRVLREAGLTRTRVAGTSRYVRLRREEIDRLYPGLLDAVLSRAAPAVTS